MLYPLTFEPIFHERVWGGRMLETLYAKPLPPGHASGNLGKSLTVPAPPASSLMARSRDMTSAG
jgi:hypothetical protein